MSEVAKSVNEKILDEIKDFLQSNVTHEMDLSCSTKPSNKVGIILVTF